MSTPGGATSSTTVDICLAEQQLQNDGFALIPGVLSQTEVARAREAIDQLQPVHWDFEGPTDHYKCVFNRSPYWLRFLDWPGIVDVCEAVLGFDCHVIGQTAWRTHPNCNGVGLHLDHLMFNTPEDVAATGFVQPAVILTAHFYLSIIDRDLCPTHVVPGSHRAGRKPRQDENGWGGEPLQPVLCAAGDVLLFRSDLWHSGSRNATSDRSRYLLQVHYGRRMIAQKFSPYLSFQFNPEVLQACNARQRRLLGDHEQAAYD